MSESISPELVARAVARMKLDIEECRKDPWYAVRKGWVITQDEKPPTGVPAVRPFPDSPHLEAVAKLWLESSKGLLCKSRQMLVSWLFAYLTLWDAIFHDGRHCLFQGKRLEDVDASTPHSILGRARFIREHLPPFLQPKVSAVNVTSETYANGSTLEAIPQGADIVRGKVPSTMFMDEVCFQETSEDNWNAAVPAAKKLWGVSTPNGHEFVYRQSDPGKSWDDWKNWPSVMPGLHGYVNSKGVQLVALHYTADELRRTPEWQEMARKGYTNTRDYLREMELDFTLAEGLGVYANEFSSVLHVVAKYEVDATSPIYLGWDTGYTGQAVSFWQVNLDGQLVWFDQVILKAVPLSRVVQEVKNRLSRYMAKASVFPSAMTIGLDGHVSRLHPSIYHYGDPAAKAHNADGESDEAILSKYGVHLVSKSSSGRKLDLVEAVRALMLPRSDGKPALLIAKNSPDMDHVVAGFAGGYHYAKPKEGKAENEVPEKDGFYDHIFDSAQYAVDNISPIRFGAFDPDAGFDWWAERDPGVGTEAYAQR